MRSLQSLTFLLLVSAAQVTGLEGKRCHTPEPPKDKIVSMFCDFMRTYNKSYKDQEEEAQRFKIFVENLEWARQQQETEIGSARYGVTKFSDISAEEFQQGSRAPSKPLQCEQFSDKLPNNIPKFVDWRKMNCVTRVKNQQVAGRPDCNSCWAFAVVGNVESHVSIREKELITLSEQELLDCGNKTNNCNGGHINLAFQDVVRRGLHREDAYPPYTAKRHNCSENVRQREYKIKKCVALQNETEMQQFVAKKGPVAIMVNILNRLQRYKGGIIRTDNQTKKTVRYHAMLIVGYGTDDDVPYWIVKNSWGEDWGEKGYVQIYRGANVGKIGDYALSSVV